MRKGDTINVRFGGRSTTFCNSVEGMTKSTGREPRGLFVYLVELNFGNLNMHIAPPSHRREISTLSSKQLH